MWGDSIRAVKCQHARITYDDFLLLMKGQTKEAPSQELERELEASVTSLKAVTGRQLHVVHEGEVEHPGAESPRLATEKVVFTGGPGGEGPVSLEPRTPLSGTAFANQIDSLLPTPAQTAASLLRPCSPFEPSASQSAPSTPADHKLVLEIDESETPPFGNEDIMSSGPGVPGTSASLTPPHSPERGARDYVTPMAADRFTVSLPHNVDSILVPGLPPDSSAYSRRRSRSVDDQENNGSESKESKDARENLHGLADAVRDMIVPESGHFHLNGLTDVVKDEKKSALVVNRQLYRAHRQMRLAVLEASKRFEEQQARHARDVILAQQEAEGKLDDSMGMIQAGLVMKHGHREQVSSEAIRKLLRDNEVEQQALVEKFNRRGGRGRRSRKKTISDMTQMMSSMGQDEMGMVAVTAAQFNEKDALPPPPEAEAERAQSLCLPPRSSLSSLRSSDPDKIAAANAAAAMTGPPAMPIANAAAAVSAASPTSGISVVGGVVGPDGTTLPVAVEGPTRESTVPGEFKKTSDPFGKKGKYGAVAVVFGSESPTE